MTSNPGSVDAMIGSTILQYRILERLGRGGMGEVFLSEDTRLHRPVALKLLRRRKGCEDEERAHVLHEARAASALNHPNIAVIYDVQESDTPEGPMFLLAMEYVPGKTLAEFAAGANLTLEAMLDLMSQTTDALAEAHARGVVHRDLKPSNLMVTDGRVKVLDFGLAQMQPELSPDATTWTRDAGNARDSGFAGTPYYMSPEQALNQPLDARSDIFSLGVVFYELIAGRRPFDGQNFVQVADAILHQPPPPLPPRFSDPRLIDVERLLVRMMAKAVADRPQDLKEVRAELQRLRTRQLPLPAAGTLTLAVAGFANITRQGEDEWLGTGLAETITAALQEIEGLEIWGRERLRETLRQLGVEASELGPEDAVQLGTLTGARWVLAGGFQRLGEQVRVTARIVEVETGQILRAVKMDGGVGAIFELQDRIVQEVTAGMRRSVNAAQEGDETQVVAAYEAFAKGLLNTRADSYESLDRSILFFEQALRHDPDYVKAQIELGAAYAQKGEYLAAPELNQRAAAILRRVLETHPRIPRAWRELGVTLIAQGRMDEGIESLRRALALAPEDARVLAGMARGLFIGKADFKGAAELYAQAVERNPQAGWYFMQLAHCYALLRDFPRGEAAARRAIELQEEFLSGQQGVQLVGAYMRLGHLLALQGKSPEAAAAFLRELVFTDRIDHALRARVRIELHMRYGAALLGSDAREQAEEAFATGLEAYTSRLALGADEPFTRYYAAAIHALRGDSEEALRLITEAAAARPAFVLARCRVEPEWDRLRSDPRFQRLLESQG